MPGQESVVFGDTRPKKNADDISNLVYNLNGLALQLLKALYRSIREIGKGFPCFKGFEQRTSVSDIFLILYLNERCLRLLCCHK